MRWSYKTVHYELKKEGFLGSTFLDESEVEQSLNDYGRAGWELVSMMETQDGLIAIFKQPLDHDIGPLTVGKVIESDVLLEEDSEGMITENDIITDDLPQEESDEDIGPHSIRIE